MRRGWCCVSVVTDKQGRRRFGARTREGGGVVEVVGPGSLVGLSSYCFGVGDELCFSCEGAYVMVAIRKRVFGSRLLACGGCCRAQHGEE